MFRHEHLNFFLPCSLSSKESHARQAHRRSGPAAIPSQGIDHLSGALLFLPIEYSNQQREQPDKKKDTIAIYHPALFLP
jgi:hypothetical protein